MWHIVEELLVGLFRLTGVCVLFVLGRLKKMVTPSTQSYSFKAIYYMEYDKADGHKQMMKRIGQQMAGFMFLLAVVAVYTLLK